MQVAHFSLPNTAYVEFKHGIPIDADAMAAYEGFDYLSLKVYPFTRLDILSNKFSSNYTKAVFVGSTQTIEMVLSAIGKRPLPLDYPFELNLIKYMRRSVKLIQTQQATEQYLETNVPFFIKSYNPKVYCGFLIREPHQLNYLEQHKDELAWMSQPIILTSEWRCFVHNCQLVDARPYQGDFTISPDFGLVNEMIRDYKGAPIAYTLDVGITSEEQTALVEVNDFWAIGGYGLAPETYAIMLNDPFNSYVNLSNANDYWVERRLSKHFSIDPFKYFFLLVDT